MGYSLMFTVIILFLGLAIYGTISSSRLANKGRQVNARVLSCEQKQLGFMDISQAGYYYEVTVDFIGLHGETITKSFRTDRQYEKEDIIRCRYEDGSDTLYPNADEIAQASPKSGLIIIGACLLILAVAVLGVWLSGKEKSEIPEWTSQAFGIFMGVLFLGIGVSGFVRQRKLNIKKPDMRALKGVQVDYKKERSSGRRAGMVYYPIYEYDLLGEKKRYKSRLGGSGRKYRQIGREVHMLVEPSTGKVYCEEDERSSVRLHAVFVVVGALIVAYMVATILGVVTF